MDDKVLKTYEMLTRGTYTASSLAKKMRCTRMTAYRRIKGALKLAKARRAKVLKIERRDGLRGPVSVAFKIDEGPTHLRSVE